MRIRLTKKDSKGFPCVLLVLENPQVKVIAGRKDNPFSKREGAGLAGGRVQPEETEERAGYRELEEETGLTNIKLYKIAEIDHSSEDSNHIICLFEGEGTDAELCPKDEAIVEARWVRLNEASGRLEHEGKVYPIYNSHLGLIHRTHPAIRHYEEAQRYARPEE